MVASGPTPTSIKEETRLAVLCPITTIIPPFLPSVLLQLIPETPIGQNHLQPKSDWLSEKSSTSDLLVRRII